MKYDSGKVNDTGLPIINKIELRFIDYFKFVSSSLEKLHWSIKVLSNEERRLFLMYCWTLNSKIFPRISLSPTPFPSDSESRDEDVGQANNNMNCDSIFAKARSSNEQHLLTQDDLNVNVRDLNLSKTRE